MRWRIINKITLLECEELKTACFFMSLCRLLNIPTVLLLTSWWWWWREQKKWKVIKVNYQHTMDTIRFTSFFCFQNFFFVRCKRRKGKWRRIWVNYSGTSYDSRLIGHHHHLLFFLPQLKNQFLHRMNRENNRIYRKKARVIISHRHMCAAVLASCFSSIVYNSICEIAFSVSQHSEGIIKRNSREF